MDVHVLQINYLISPHKLFEMRSFCLMLIFVSFISCKKNATDKAQYYVKYVVKGGASYPLVASSTKSLHWFDDGQH